MMDDEHGIIEKKILMVEYKRDITKGWKNIGDNERKNKGKSKKEGSLWR